MMRIKECNMLNSPLSPPKEIHWKTIFFGFCNSKSPVKITHKLMKERETTERAPSVFINSLCCGDMQRKIRAKLLLSMSLLFQNTNSTLFFLMVSFSYFTTNTFMTEPHPFFLLWQIPCLIGETYFVTVFFLSLTFVVKFL